VSSLYRAKPLDMPLTDDEQAVMEAYHAHLGWLAFYMFDYLYIACARETRHLMAVPPSWQDVLGPELESLVDRLQEASSADDGFKNLKNIPEIPLGAVTRALSAQFFWGRYDQSFGGPKWGEVAYTVNQFVHGYLSPELFIDTAWTLAHNTGPVFNKGMVFHCQDSPYLLRILNAQRSGQIPGFVQTLDNQDVQQVFRDHKERTASFQKHRDLCRDVAPSIFTPFDQDKAESISGQALYPNIDFTFGFDCFADGQHVAPSARKRVHQHYGGRPAGWPLRWDNPTAATPQPKKASVPVNLIDTWYVASRTEVA